MPTGGLKALGPVRTPPPTRLRRFWAHLTRTRARNALWLTAFAILLYAFAPNVIGSPSLLDPFREFILILAGVAAGAVFLPELSGELWNLKRDDVLRLIPEPQRREMARVLISAESDDSGWNSLVYEEALRPMLDASANPCQFVWNMNYLVEAHLNQRLSVSGRTLHYHGIQIHSNSERVLPELVEGTFWISVARTPRALMTEYRNPACLAREVVSLEWDSGGLLNNQEWQKVVRDHCSVRVTINGEPQKLQLEGGADVIRWKLCPDLPSPHPRVPILIEFDFPIRSTEDRFPVYFSGFYCAGATVVSMKVFNLPSGAELCCDDFFARGLMTSHSPGTGDESLNDEPNSNGEAKGLLSSQAAFNTGRNSILWPGSGVLFDWHHCTSAVWDSKPLPFAPMSRNPVRKLLDRFDRMES